MTRSSPAATYDDDFFAWTQEQAAALRAVPAERIGAGVDIAHVAEEIEDLGKRDLREVTSFLELVLTHLIKIDTYPTSLDVRHWRSEARTFQRSARKAFSPGMRQHLDLQAIWREMRRTAGEDAVDAGLDLQLPVDCPFVFDDLMSDAFDLDHVSTLLEKAPRPDAGRSLGGRNL